MRSFRFGKLPILVLLLGLVLAACGNPQRVGDEVDLDFEQQRNAERLGAKQSPEPEAENEGQGSLTVEQSPTPPPSPNPDPQAAVFNIALIEDPGFYYEVDGKPVNCIEAPLDVRLKITNTDDTPERPTRSFTAVNRAFDSGPLAFGASWTSAIVFDQAGFWDVEDVTAPFIRGTLVVGARC